MRKDSPLLAFYYDRLPSKKEGGPGDGIFDSVVSKLNPFNWGVTDYSKSGSFKNAYSAALKNNEKEFMYNNKRYNTNYKGTEQQQLSATGITNNQRMNQNVFRKALRNIDQGSGSEDVDEGYNGYPNPFNALGDLLAGKKYNTQDDPEQTDMLNIYAGAPQKNNTLGVSRYKPTKIKENNASTYYRVNPLNNKMPNQLTQEQFDYVLKNKAFSDYLPNFNSYVDEQGKPHNNYRGLGTFTIDAGKDDRGDYISYYDKWDLNPFSSGKNAPDLSLGVGKPYEIYDRIYYKDYGNGVKKRMYYNDSELSNLDFKSKNFDTKALQRELANRGYNLSKSFIKDDEDYDGILGEETKKAYLDWKSKYQTPKKEYGGITKYGPGGMTKDPNKPYSKSNPEGYVSLKNNRDWFDSHANWTNTGNPEWDAKVRQQILTGRFGLDPKSGALIKLDKNEWVNVPSEYKREATDTRQWTPEQKQQSWEKKVKPQIVQSTKDLITNPVMMAPGAILTGGMAAGIPAISRTAAAVVPALETSIGGIPGLTAGNLINAGFAYQGAKNLPNVASAWKDVANKPTWGGVGNALGQTALTAIDILPFASTAAKGIPSVMQDVNQAGNYLTTQTPLKSTYKLNPWAFKPQEGMMYRGLGQEGMEDAIQSGVFRPKQHGYAEGRSLAEKVTTPKQFGSTFYAPAERFGVVENYGPSYLAEVPFEGNEFARRYGRKDWSWSTPRQIPIEEGRILQKNWLRGYKEVPKPTSLSSTVETPSNLSTINLERGSPKSKSKMYKASEVVDDPHFNIKKIFRGDKEVPKEIKIVGKSGDWTVNKSKDGTYYFNASMSNPLESGKAMLKINELLPSKSTILEPNSLSLDSYKNVLKLGKRPGWKMEFENYIPLNHSAIHDKSLADKFGFTPDAYTVPFESLEDANKALKEVNAMLKKQGINYEADVFSNGIGLYGIKIPNFKLTRGYKKGGKVNPLQQFYMSKIR